MKCLICQCDEADLLSSDIDEEQCVHNYECMDCGCTFSLLYVIADTKIDQGLAEDDDEHYIEDDEYDDDEYDDLEEEE